MTKFAVVIPAKPQGGLDTMPDFFAPSVWRDVARELVSGSDRGVIHTASSAVESMLKDLLLSDPGEPDPAMRAMLKPGGPLCARPALLNFLEANGFIGNLEAAAIACLFKCADEYFGWSDAARLEAAQWEMLRPLLEYTVTSAESADTQDYKETFFFSFWELTTQLDVLIANRESGLA